MTEETAIGDSVNTASSPSQLKITDLRLAVVASNYDYPILRIDTNQGIYGIGEVRDAGHRENALQYKHILVGQNPCNVDGLFRHMKHYGNWGREGGGVSGIELALWDGFREMIEKRAVDIIHPDLLTSGGMAETKRIADYAERYGLPTALHFAGSPIAFMANLHCAAAIPSFVALEHHGLDLPFWRDLVTGLDADYLQDGYVTVSDKPGLGVDLNYEGIEANLRRGGLFEPTDEWNDPKLGFWKPDNRWG